MTDEIKGNEWYPRIGPGSVFAPTEIKPTMTDTPTPALDAAFTDEKLHKFGWAPGGYTGPCLDCEERYYGEKRCTRCRDCAAKMAIAEQANPHAPDAKSIPPEALRGIGEAMQKRNEHNGYDETSPDAVEHASEPWRCSPELTRYTTHAFYIRQETPADGRIGDVAYIPRSALQPSHANAHRIVACVNALAGVSTADIEAGTVAALALWAGGVLMYLGNEGGFSFDHPGMVEGANIISKFTTMKGE